MVVKHYRRNGLLFQVFVWSTPLVVITWITASDRIVFILVALIQISVHYLSFKIRVAVVLDIPVSTIQV